MLLTRGSDQVSCAEDGWLAAWFACTLDSTLRDEGSGLAWLAFWSRAPSWSRLSSFGLAESADLLYSDDPSVDAELVKDVVAFASALFALLGSCQDSFLLDGSSNLASCFWLGVEK